MMKPVLTKEAKFDLDDIGDWIADYDPTRAVTFVDELMARCAKLTGMPHAYRRFILTVALAPITANSRTPGIESSRQPMTHVRHGPTDAPLGRS
jgi:plasmid stabilization system protein ParE